MPRTIKELAKEALDVQDACNLSGVVHGFSRAMKDLWEHAHAEGHGTDWVNTHFVAVLYADKVAHLTGTQAVGNDRVMLAYAEAHAIQNGIVRIEPGKVPS